MAKACPSVPKFWVAASCGREGSNAERDDLNAEVRFAQYQVYPWRGLKVAEGD